VSGVASFEATPLHAAPVRTATEAMKAAQLNVGLTIVLDLPIATENHFRRRRCATVEVSTSTPCPLCQGAKSCPEGRFRS
jgi:hypothetical protein